MRYKDLCAAQFTRNSKKVKMDSLCVNENMWSGTGLTAIKEKCLENTTSGETVMSKYNLPDYPELQFYFKTEDWSNTWFSIGEDVSGTNGYKIAFETISSVDYITFYANGVEESTARVEITEALSTTDWVPIIIKFLSDQVQVSVGPYILTSINTTYRGASKLINGGTCTGGSSYATDAVEFDTNDEYNNCEFESAEGSRHLIIDTTAATNRVTFSTSVIPSGSYNVWSIWKFFIGKTGDVDHNLLMGHLFKRESYALNYCTTIHSPTWWDGTYDQLLQYIHIAHDATTSLEVCPDFLLPADCFSIVIDFGTRSIGGATIGKGLYGTFGVKSLDGRFGFYVKVYLNSGDGKTYVAAYNMNNYALTVATEITSITNGLTYLKLEAYDGTIGFTVQESTAAKSGSASLTIPESLMFYMKGDDDNTQDFIIESMVCGLSSSASYTSSSKFYASVMKSVGQTASPSSGIDINTTPGEGNGAL